MLTYRFRKLGIVPSVHAPLYINEKIQLEVCTEWLCESIYTSTSSISKTDEIYYDSMIKVA